jgi:hypothetical protein
VFVLWHALRTAQTPDLLLGLYNFTRKGSKCQWNFDYPSFVVWYWHLRAAQTHLEFGLTLEWMWVTVIENDILLIEYNPVFELLKSSFNYFLHSLKAKLWQKNHWIHQPNSFDHNNKRRLRTREKHVYKNK